MERHDACYRQYVQILREELRPATGCTEPIAIAYAAAKARSVLGALPDRVLVEVSGNIIKNVKSVVVPHTGGLRGIPAAAAAGIVAGDAEAQLEVLSAMTEEQSASISPFLKVVPVEVRHADTPYIFDIQVTVFTARTALRCALWAITPTWYPSGGAVRYCWSGRSPRAPAVSQTAAA